MKKLFPLLFTLCVFATGNLFSAEEISTLEADDIPDYQRIWAGVDIQYVPISYPNYNWGAGPTDQNGKGLRIGAEFIGIDGIFGKVGIGTGAGFYSIANVPISNGTASLRAIPVEAYLSYRLDIFQNQVLVPFFKAGPTWTSLYQWTSGSPDYSESAYTMEYTFGVEFLMDVIDPNSASSLNHRVGIRNTYAVLEYHRARFLTGAADLAADNIRVGLRFEM
jgi:hypothetical protein